MNLAGKTSGGKERASIYHPYEQMAVGAFEWHVLMQNADRFTHKGNSLNLEQSANNSVIVRSSKILRCEYKNSTATCVCFVVLMQLTSWMSCTCLRSEVQGQRGNMGRR